VRGVLGAGVRGVTPQNRSTEELEMRRCCADHLRRIYPDGRLIHELPLRYSTRRIDLASVTPDRIIAVEIKSSRDTTDRLEAQLRGFAPICSRIYVALAPVWNEALPGESMTKKNRTVYRPRSTEAQALIAAVRRDAPWIATWTCDPDAADPIRLTAGYYGENTHPWPAKMLDVLHVAELERLCAEHGVAPGSSHARLCDALLGALRGPQVARAVCAALRARDAFCAGTDAPVGDVRPAARQVALL